MPNQHLPPDIRQMLERRRRVAQASAERQERQVLNLSVHSKSRSSGFRSGIMIRHPHKVFLLVWVMLVLGLLYGSLFIPSEIITVPWFVSLFLSLNMATFLLFFLDKAIAHTHMVRVPEKVLWAVAFFGGSPGALIGMYLFRHKTAKFSFQFVLGILLLIQVALLALAFSNSCDTIDGQLLCYESFF